jgi:hypothetical protein
VSRRASLTKWPSNGPLSAVWEVPESLWTAGTNAPWRSYQKRWAGCRPLGRARDKPSPQTVVIERRGTRPSRVGGSF